MSDPGSVAAAPTAHGATRIEGLITWRALLMLAGLPLHAVLGQQDYPPFAAIVLVSASFRMGAFFMISGLLSGFALSRRANAFHWLRHRFVQLGWPTLFGLAIISPVVGMLRGVAQPLWPIEPYHIWFLMALLAYSAIGFAVHRIDRVVPVFAGIEQRPRRARRLQVALLLIVGLLSFTLMSIGCLIDAQAPAALRPTTAHLALILGYVPVFLLGLAAARAPTLWRMLTASHRIPAAILGIALAAHLVLRSPWMLSLAAHRWHEWADWLALGSAAWCPPAAAVLILRSAVAIRRVPPLLDRLADASFTIYMLHYPIIVATKIFLGPLGWNIWIEFAVAILVGGGVSYAAHRWIVMPVPIMALLIAGRPLPATPRDAAPAASCRGRSSISAEEDSGELLLPGAPRTAGIPFCCPVGSDRAILE